jgi:hypothetical protein
MTDREPDSSFPGRDTYGRRSKFTREGSSVSMIAAALVAFVLILGALFFLGKL